MTEQMAKMEVRLGGATHEVITREEAERIVREASSEHLVYTALMQATEKLDGAAALDLTTGKIVAVVSGDGGSYIDCPATLVCLFELSTDDFSEFSPEVVGDILGEDEAQKIVAAREYEDADEIPEGDAERFLAAYTDESYDDRFCDAYLLLHGLDAPTGEDLIARVREGLDEVYVYGGGE